MNRSKRTRKTAILAVALACVLFTAGAGQAKALEFGQEGDFGPHVVINMLERIGSFVSDLAVEVVDLFAKAGSSPAQDG